MASGGEEGVTFLSSPLASVVGEQQRRERGERPMRPIMVETIASPGAESWGAAAAAARGASRGGSREATPLEGRGSKEGTPGARGKEGTPLTMDERINYISGNPFVEVIIGEIEEKINKK